MTATFALVTLLGAAACSALAVTPAAAKDVLWLPIVATLSNVADALATADVLRRPGSDLQLVATDDCRNLHKGMVIAVAGLHTERTVAQSRIDRWREQGVADAYLRRCELVVPSRLSEGLPLLDPSFIGRPVTAINWGLDDAVSRVQGVGTGRLALIVPRYEADPEDVREGLRIGVRLRVPDRLDPIELASDCIDPEFVSEGAHLALTCVSETAASYLLHRTQLHLLADGRRVAEQARCTEPSFDSGRWICQKESVDADGHLALEPTVLYPR